ncbi:unnamed protein product [Ambrosiozyma monospora]|uniref:Unnamed protein product n=1 Tax=Ambrosiozyma monospora TaxID=43982 RepID=A0ACB5U8J1_AMBMO|nr:unnamed protein product [Ambrosiozyma monospora]
MFDALVENGAHFKGELWDKTCKELLFPMFEVLNKRWQVSSTQDDMSVWLSTTLIQALRNMIGLFGYYFDELSRMLDGYLNLLVSCICQDNETISKIGISCLKDIVIHNITKFGPKHWEKIDDAFAQLFKLTTANELFLADPLRKQQNGDAGDEPGAAQEESDEDEEILDGTSTAIDESTEQNDERSTIVIKCVLQLHMIQILSELFETDEFYDNIPIIT